jgi:hypothetical protein
MPFKSEIRPVRGYRGAEVRENPYLTPNASLSLKATLPRRGRVRAENRPDQARSKPGASQEQARCNPGATQVARAFLYHLPNLSPGPLDHSLRASRVIGKFGSGIEMTKKGAPKIALDQGKLQNPGGILRLRLPGYSLGEGLKAVWRITG